MRQNVQLFVGIAVSVVCVGLAIRGLALDQVGNALAGARYRWLWPALALYFAGVWVRAVRWRHLLRPLADIPSARLFPVVVIGYMANDVLPARLGEIARCYVLRRREGVPQAAALGTVLLERIMDGITMLAFMAGALPFLPFSAGLYRLMGGAAVLFASTTAFLVALMARPALAARLLHLLGILLPSRAAEPVQRLGASFLTGLTSLRGASTMLRLFALSSAAWLLEAGMYYALMFAFPLAPSLPLAVLTTAVANLGTLIPSSPGYVGVFDFIGRSVLAQFGVAEEVALAYVLVVHAALIIPITLLGFWYTWRQGLALRRLASPTVTATNAPA